MMNNDDLFLSKENTISSILFINGNKGHSTNKTDFYIWIHILNHI